MVKKSSANELSKSGRYRLKDIDAYRKRKREYAKTPAQRKKRAAYQRLWAAKNREKANSLAREYRRKWTDDRREAARVYARKYWAENRDKLTANERRRYAKMSPEKRSKIREAKYLRNRSRATHPKASRRASTCRNGHDMAVYGRVIRGGRSHGCRECHRVYMAEYKKRDPKARKRSYLRLVYGYDGDLADACEMCGSVNRLCLDHDHVTGVIRGTLCHRCNVGIGMLNDSVDVIKSAVLYLRRASKKTMRVRPTTSKSKQTIRRTQLGAKNEWTRNRKSA